MGRCSVHCSLCDTTFTPNNARGCMPPTADQVKDHVLSDKVAAYRGLLPDWKIKNLNEASGMIDPFVDHQVKIEDDGTSVISYGLSSTGYDIRVAEDFMIFSPSTGEMTVVNPKAFDKKSLVTYTGKTCVIPPNSFALARSVEYFRMPQHITGLCLGKSTYARAGIVTNFTPFEPGWCGYVTIEISNTTPLPAIIYANEGIAQVLFFATEEPEVTYADRKGKYQGQTGITLPKV